MTSQKTSKDEVVKIGKIKLAFLYVLIGGLSVSAIIAIIAVLTGEFSSALQKTFGTAILFILHSTFILGLIWSDKSDSIGRKILPTVLLAVALANLTTSTLGTWGIIEGDMAGRAILFYSLIVGSSFIVSGLLKLRVSHKPSRTLLYSTIGSVITWTLALTPWVFDISAQSIYFRIVGALTILSVTLLIVSVVIRQIAVSQSKKLQAESKVNKSYDPIQGGLLAYYVIVGCIVSIVWFVGMISFIASSSQQEYRANYGDKHLQRR